MPQGLATKLKLHRLNTLAPDPYPLVPALQRQLQRLMVWILPPKKEAGYDLIIQDTFIPCAFGPRNLGTPREARRSKLIRAGINARKLLAWGAIFGIGMMAGRQADPDTIWRSAERIQAEAAITTHKVRTNATPAKALMLVRYNCQYDWHEGCTVCTHKSDLGEVVKTSMC